MEIQKITMKRKKVSLEDSIDFVTDGNVSDLSELSFDESDDDINMLPKISIEESKNNDTDDDIPLSVTASSSADNNEGNPEAAIKHIYQWRKKDTFAGQPPQTEMTPYYYFKICISPEIIDCIVEQTNLYSF